MLVSAYSERLYWVIRRMVLNHDDANDVLCRLELHQCSKTVVTPETKNLLLILEGHDDTPDELLQETARTLVNRIVQYHGGVGAVYQAEVEDA